MGQRTLYPRCPGRLYEGAVRFFGSTAIADGKRPILAGLNYFLTHEARGGSSKKLLGEKKDVKVWLGWLERQAHGDVDAIETPIGFMPRYDDLKALFETLIDKPYPKTLYDQQFSLYVDNILARIDLQTAAYGKEENIPGQLFDVLRETAGRSDCPENQIWFHRDTRAIIERMTSQTTHLK
jgi:phosphoenolpyruvate carboxykinase (GTP)